MFIVLGTVGEVMSLDSLEPAAATFRCSQTETHLANCLGEKPENVTCRHLLLACVRDQLATSSSPPQPTGDFPTATDSRLGRPAPSPSSQFPVVGVVVGMFSALLLVGVVAAVGVVSGAILWRRNQSKSLAIARAE